MIKIPIMRNLFLLFLFVLSLFNARAQIRKWHVDKKVTVHYLPVNQKQDGRPVIDTSNITVISFNFDKARISIYCKDSVENYDCYDFRKKVIPSHINKTETLMQAIDDYGNHCKINIQLGEDDTQFKGYNGMIQVLYSTIGYLYYLTDPD